MFGTCVYTNITSIKVDTIVLREVWFMCRGHSSARVRREKGPATQTYTCMKRQLALAEITFKPVRDFRTFRLFLVQLKILVEKSLIPDLAFTATAVAMFDPLQSCPSVFYYTVLRLAVKFFTPRPVSCSLIPL